MASRPRAAKYAQMKTPEISSGLARQVDTLQALVEAADTVAGFTGAGISTESGIPDFRSPDSPWMRNKPIPFAAFAASAEARREAWRRKFVMDDLYRGARPNRGHLALASLVSRGRMAAVITQNIDGLHQQSGIPEERVVELHGNGTYAACLACARRHELDWVRTHLDTSGDPPACVECGGIIKAATISFGQAMPSTQMRRAREVTLACDLFLAVGSSLVVYPAAGFPVLAKRNGARLVIINREATDLDGLADLVIRADIGAVLERFIVRN